MSRTIFSAARLITASRLASPVVSKTFQNNFSASSARAFTAFDHVSRNFISRITTAEKQITKQDNPIPGGPTAKAQSHHHQPLTEAVIYDIFEGERKITGLEEPLPEGPTAVALTLMQLGIQNNDRGVPITQTISNIIRKEKEITGKDAPVRGGPTARAQQHAGEQINSEVLHDITEGEKKITGGERIKGGPTSVAQSELAKSRR